jgi:hypothetical protein
MSFLPTIDRRCNGGGGHPLKKMISASHRRRRFDVSDYFRFGPWSFKIFVIKPPV